MAARATPKASRLAGSRPTMCLTAFRPAGNPPALERARHSSDVVVKAALGDQGRDQQAFGDRPEIGAAAGAVDHQTENRRAADQHDGGDDAALAPRCLAADLAVEPPVEERDRATRENHRMRNAAEHRRHIAKQRIDDKGAEQQRQSFGEIRQYHVLVGFDFFRRDTG